jgi:hypothetical protein
MYFDFEDYRPDTPRIDSAISKREGVLLSIVLHALFVVLILVLAPLESARRLEAIKRAEELALQRQQQQSDEERRFVFVQPRVDLEALRPPERADLSDRDRQARAPERAPDPQNALPFARGNSVERVEADSRVAREREQPAPETPLKTPDEGRDANLGEQAEGNASDK